MSNEEKINIIVYPLYAMLLVAVVTVCLIDYVIIDTVERNRLYETQSNELLALKYNHQPDIELTIKDGLVTSKLKGL